MPDNEIGEKIKFYRSQKKMTQKELADKIGASYQQISQYERGQRKPKIETLRKIADALDTETLCFISPFERLGESYLAYIRKTKDIKALHEYNSAVINYVGSELDKIEFSLVPGHSFEDAITILDAAGLDADLMLSIVNALFNLNAAGRQEAIKRVEELSEIPRYQRYPASTSEETPVEDEGTDNDEEPV